MSIDGECNVVVRGTRSIACGGIGIGGIAWRGEKMIIESRGSDQSIVWVSDVRECETS
jgi:hypothetical protein